MLTHATLFNQLGKKLLFWLVPKPDTGYFPFDLFYLLEIIILQSYVLPTVFSGYMLVDFVTPWLIYIVIANSIWKGALLAAIASMILENHSAVPSGLYFCSYWFIGTLIVLVCNHISWRQKQAWVVSSFLAEVLIVMLEFMVVYAKMANTDAFSLNIALASLSRIILALAIGFCSYHYFVLREGDKPT